MNQYQEATEEIAVCCKRAEFVGGAGVGGSATTIYVLLGIRPWLHILDIAIFNSNGERRSLSFQPGKVNIITGGSQTGKTALIDIVDYCLARTEYTVRAGVIRDTVKWYVVRLQVKGQQVVIGRPAPPNGQKTCSEVFLNTQRDRMPSMRS